MKVRIYVEGGFEGSTKSDCRRAFSTFLGRAIRPGSFKVIASGSRQQAYEDFCSGLRQHTDEYIILLVDSEAAVIVAPWRHLGTREGDQWKRPAGTDDQAHLMVQSDGSLVPGRSTDAFYLLWPGISPEFLARTERH